MGWRDRPYAHEESHYHGSGLNALSVTTLLIIANVALAFLTDYSHSRFAEQWLVMEPAAVLHGQVWRLFTATYLHGFFNHLLFNMLGLYFLGPPLEQVWGRRQYFFVHTIGGIAGNVLYTLAGLVGYIDPYGTGVGASGSILTLLGAAAVLFPDAQIFVYFLFPIRIRTIAIVYGVLYVLNIGHRGPNYGGDLSHIAGLVVGIVWAWTGGISLSGRHRIHAHPGSLLGRLFQHRPASPGQIPGQYGSASERGSAGSASQRQWRIAAGPYPDEEVVDRILAKIHERGIASLTEDEKRILHDAQQRRQAEERGQR